MEPGFPSLEEAGIAIIGLGLMGGSFALALREANIGHPLIGIDIDAHVRAQAASCFDAVSAELAPIRRAHLVVLSAPVRAILQLLPDVAAYAAPETIVLDFGSTKQVILEAMRRLPPHLQAIGGHPLCGREQSGFSAARADLFRGTRFVLTPLERTSPQALRFVEALLERLQIQPLYLSAEDHDRLLAQTSHLPYLLSASLMQLAAQSGAEDGRLFQVMASGFRDTSRLAGSDPRMMLDILMTNRRNVLEALSAFQGVLSELREWLENEEEAPLQAWMQANARQRRELERLFSAPRL